MFPATMPASGSSKASRASSTRPTRGHRRRAIKTIYERAVRMMRSSGVKAFDLDEEPDELRDAYGRNQFGQGCLLARSD